MQETQTLILPCPQPFSSAMSGVAAFADMGSTLHKKPGHRRDGSDELDVFEAASYYSGVADASFRSGIIPYGGTMKEERRAFGGGTRRSIDVPMSAPLPSQYSHRGEKPTKEKKTKQPISPGGRLASFLNSFFHQGSSKKKSKSASITASAARSCKDEDSESPGGRRKRRSSVSHSRSTRTTSESSSLIFCPTSSGFQTPSLVFPHEKVLKEETRAHPRSKCSGQATPASSCPPTEAFREGRSRCADLPWEKISRRASTNGIFQKGGCSDYGADSPGSAAYCGGQLLAEKKWVLNKDSKGMACRDLLRAGELLAAERNLWRREEEEDDGSESDSSSDLFELPNCDLVHFASGLPVYETTSMDRIKRGSSSIASVAL